MGGKMLMAAGWLVAFVGMVVHSFGHHFGGWWPWLSPTYWMVLGALILLVVLSLVAEVTLDD